MENSKQPINFIAKTNLRDEYLGLTKREHFAGLAMQGLLAHGWNVHEYEEMSKHAARAADALLNALSK